MRPADRLLVALGGVLVLGGILWVASTPLPPKISFHVEVEMKRELKTLVSGEHEGSFREESTFTLPTNVSEILLHVRWGVPLGHVGEDEIQLTLLAPNGTFPLRERWSASAPPTGPSEISRSFRIALDSPPSAGVRNATSLREVEGSLPTSHKAEGKWALAFDLLHGSPLSSAHTLEILLETKRWSAKVHPFGGKLQE